MLDPEWTPARGYAHALDLLRRAEAAETAAREAEKTEEEATALTGPG